MRMRLTLLLLLPAALSFASPAGFNERIFYLTDEFYGAGAYNSSDVTSNIRNAMV